MNTRIWLIVLFFGLALGSLANAGSLSIGSLSTSPTLNLNSTHLNSYGQAVAACAVCNVIAIQTNTTYGKVASLDAAPAGNSIYYSNVLNGNNYVYNVIIQKNPSYICINLTSSVFNESECSPGDYGIYDVLGSKTPITITAHLTTELVGSQQIPYSASITTKNGQVFGFDNYTTGSIEETKTFTYYPGQPLTIQFDSLGDNNYSAEDPILTTQCTNNWKGGACLGNINYNTVVTLSNNINATGNILFLTGGDLITNSFNIWIAGTFNSANGIVFTGNVPNSGTTTANNCYNTLACIYSFFSSFAGSGGAAGGGGGGATNGGSTLAAGGISPGGDSTGGAGSTPAAPVMSNANIISWYNNGVNPTFGNYLTSGTGGGSANGNGGNSVYGVYIQANKIIEGTINAGGVSGLPGGGDPGGGGSGGGVIMLVYGPGGFVAGTNTVTGGSGAGGYSTGGAGGAGMAVTYQYSTQPINTPASATVTLTLSNTAIDQGQGILITANVIGNPPYSYNFYVVNQITNVIIANMLFPTNTYPTNSWFWLPTANYYIGNTVAINVVITDNEPAIFNSVYTDIGYNAAFNALGITPGNEFAQIGSTVNFASTQSGGTAPFHYQWLYGLTGCGAGSSQVGGATSNTYGAVITGNTYYCLGATDSATTNEMLIGGNSFISTSQLWTPLYLLNITPHTNLVSNYTLGGNAVFTWNSYYPILFQSESVKPQYIFSMTSIPAIIGEPTNVPNIYYQPPSNIPTGNYVFSIVETNTLSGNTLTFTIAVNTLTMNIIANAFSYNMPLIQRFIDFAYTPKFNVIPASWYIKDDLPYSYSNTITPAMGDEFSNDNITFTPNLILTYPSFIPFAVNTVDNPTINSITQYPFNWVLQNTILTSNRLVLNFSIYNQESLNPLAWSNEANTAFNALINSTFDGYQTVNIVSNSMWKNFYLQMPVSNFLNPNIIVQVNDSALVPVFYAHYDTQCPITTSYSTNAQVPVGMVDTNGSKVSYYITQSSGQTAQGDIMVISEQKGVGTTLAQSLYIPNVQPLVAVLEATGQLYSYSIYNPGCSTKEYHSGLQQPVSPSYIIVNSSTSGIVYNVTKAVGSCINTGTSNNIVNQQFDDISCNAIDSANQTYSYWIQIYERTSIIGSQVLVYNQTFGSANSPVSYFTDNFTLPVSTYPYSYTLYMENYKSSGQGIWSVLNAGNLTKAAKQLAAPLLGFIAFLMLLIGIIGGATTGRVTIMFLIVDVEMILLMLFIPILIDVVGFFIVLSVIISWWLKFK